MRVIFLTWALDKLLPVGVLACVEAVHLEFASERNLDAGCRYHDPVEHRCDLGPGLGSRGKAGLRVIEDQFNLRGI